MGVVILAAVLLAPARAGAVDRAAASTTVSFTFTGGYRGQEAAAQVLARHHLNGTFYVSSHFVGLPDYLSIHELRALSASGSEIGGGATRHQDLAGMPMDQVLAEVCDDRVALASWGFPVRSFAYPYGSGTYAAQAAVKRCGYNSARGVAQLRVSDTHCTACPTAESVPPLNPYNLRTTSPGTTVEELTRVIARAQHLGGGWVVVALGPVCDCPDRAGSVSSAQLEELVRWVASRSPRLQVRTVGQVVGGPVRETVAVSALRPARSSAVPTPARSLSQMPAWRILGAEIGQVQILLTGMLSAVVLVVAYRLGTRGSRYAR